MRFLLKISFLHIFFSLLYFSIFFRNFLIHKFWWVSDSGSVSGSFDVPPLWALAKIIDCKWRKKVEKVINSVSRSLYLSLFHFCLFFSTQNESQVWQRIQVLRRLKHIAKFQIENSSKAIKDSSWNCLKQRLNLNYYYTYFSI